VELGKRTTRWCLAVCTGPGGDKMYTVHFDAYRGEEVYNVKVIGVK
jgi:hypothetical protein